MKTFPAVLFVSRYGRIVALIVGLLVGLLAVGCVIAGGGVIGLAAGLVLALGTWAGLRVFAELVEVVAETLLPR